MDHPRFEQTPGLASLKSVSHGFFGRDGGVSEGIHKGLNVGTGSKDNPEHVIENRARLGRVLGAVDAAHVLSAYQIHSATAIVVDGPFENGERPEGDALVTKRPGLALCALAADCTPVLLADPIAGVIASIHAGWRGAVAGVIEAALTTMEEQGASVTDIVAGIGPCISQESFEVGPELRKAFLAASPWSESLFVPGKGDRLHCDLKGFCRERMIRAGVSRVDVLEDDTLTNPDQYFSNRYSVRMKHSDYGRNGSAILLRE